MTMHIMLDLESLGTNSYAAILSVGAVAFDPWSKEVNYSFHMGVTLESALKYGRVDASTLEWWLTNPDLEDARYSLAKLAKEDLDNVLFGFAEWVRSVSNGENARAIWGNGAVFDNVVLSNAYTAVGYDKPWNYRADRCFRTLRALAPRVKPPTIAGGVAHDALYDARLQAMWLQKIVKKLKLEDL